MYSQEQFGKDFIELSFLMSAIDGKPERREAAVMALFLSFWIRDPEVLEGLAEHMRSLDAREVGRDIDVVVFRIMAGLDDAQKETMVTQMIAMAKINGVLHPNETELLKVLVLACRLPLHSINRLERIADVMVNSIEFLKNQ